VALFILSCFLVLLFFAGFDGSPCKSFVKILEVGLMIVRFYPVFLELVTGLIGVFGFVSLNIQLGETSKSFFADVSCNGPLMQISDKPRI
jgi:hypothetical protein